MGAKKNVDKTVNTDTIKIISQDVTEPTEAAQVAVKSKAKKSSQSTKLAKSKASNNSTKAANKASVDQNQSIPDHATNQDPSINPTSVADQPKKVNSSSDLVESKSIGSSQDATAIGNSKTSQLETSESDSTSKPTKTSQTRGKRYVATRSLVDRTLDYPLADAIDLVTKTSYSKFVGTITADLVVREIGDQGTLTFPHSTGKTVNVEIASEATLTKLEKGVIDFDILLTEPTFVPKLAKYAHILGPKGLMPNPKNGTITAQPAKRKKELEAGAITIKSERKAPLCHVIIGNTKMTKSELLVNAGALLTTLKGRVLKMTLSATMGPGVKVKVEK